MGTPMAPEPSPHWRKRRVLMDKAFPTETTLACPDFNEPFHVCADASDCQLGAVIMQEDKPLAFHGRKLNAAQKNHTAGEQELFCPL